MPIATGTPSNSFSDSLVILFLQSRHFHPEDLLHFGWQRFLHILLHSAQEKWLQDFVKALVAVLSTFPVVLFKILPELKPGTERRRKEGSEYLLSYGTKQHLLDTLLLHHKTGDHPFNGNTVEDKRFTLLRLTKQMAGKARSSLGLDAFLTSYI